MTDQDSRFNEIWQIIEQVDSTVANIRAALRLKKLLKLPQNTWHFWSQQELAAIDIITNAQVRAANKLQDVEAEKWIKECELAYKTPPGRGIFGLMGHHYPTPEFYKGRLNGIRLDLYAINNGLTQPREQLTGWLEALRINQVIIDAVSQWCTDSNEKILLINRLHTLISAQQTATLLLTNIINTQALAQSQIQSLDTLITITISNWQMSLAGNR